MLHAAAASARFDHAVELLLLVRRKVETTLAAELACRELDQALRQPPPPEAPSDRVASHPAHAHGPHATAVVRAMLDHVQAHYHHPLTISDLAATLGMNASCPRGLKPTATVGRRSATMTAARWRGGRVAGV